MSEIAQTDSFGNKTNIKVVGVGGAGGNALNRMVSEGLKDVEFIAINTDDRDLLRSEADVKISLADQSSRGLGAGADPEKGAKAAQDHQSDIEEALKGSDMVFVTAGEGGGTGTGASPLVARSSRQLGALTIAVVTRPFSFEGARRSASADSGIENLRKEVDALIVIPNDRLRDLSDKHLSVVDAFRMADEALLSGVRGVSDLITNPSPYINVDFNDVKAILKDAGTALFGMGSARGEDRAKQAAEIAISSPLLEESIDGAHGVLVTVAGSNDLGLEEAAVAVEMVQQVIHPEAQIIWGLTLDDAYGDDMRVTVIAAGFDGKSPSAVIREDPAQKKQAPKVPSSWVDGAVRKVEVPPLAPIHYGDSAPVSEAAGQQTAQPQRVAPVSSGQSAVAPKPTQRPSKDDDDTNSEIDIPAFLR